MQGMNLETIKARSGLNTVTSSQKFISLGTNPASSGDIRPYNESTINEIKMAAPFGSEKNSGREHMPQTICTDRESSNFDELRMCNEIID